MQVCYAKEREARPFLQYGGADHMGPGRGWNANHVARRGWLRGRGRNTAEPPRARLLTGHAPQPLWGPVRGGGVEPSSWPFTPAWLRPWDRWSSGDLVRPLAERWADKAAWLRSWPHGQPAAGVLAALTSAGWPLPRWWARQLRRAQWSRGIQGSAPSLGRNSLWPHYSLSASPGLVFLAPGAYVAQPVRWEKLKRPRVTFYRPGATLGLDRWCCSGFGSSG